MIVLRTGDWTTRPFGEEKRILVQFARRIANALITFDIGFPTRIGGCPRAIERSDYESEGRTFESFRARQQNQALAENRRLRKLN